jgi:hydrogenase expression/formation protein HypC
MYKLSAVVRDFIRTFASTISKKKSTNMCLGIPSKIVSINGEMAVVSVGGTEYEASVQLLDDVKTGDYVLVHTGFAIQIISEEKAQETLKLFKEMEDIEGQINGEKH